MGKDPEDSDSDFLREMRALGVKPMAAPAPAPVVHRSRSPIKPGELHKIRREAAQRESPRQNPLDDAVREWLGPHDMVSFCRPGLQHTQFRAFRQGKILPLATLDLHRCRVEQARDLLRDFVGECRREGIRCALVMHGKGYHSRLRDEVVAEAGKISRIKSFAVHWLQQMDEVLAIASAQPRDGGTGAVYVLFTSREGAGKLPPPRQGPR